MPTDKYEIINKETGYVVEIHHCIQGIAFASKYYSNDRHYVKETNLTSGKYIEYSLNKAYTNWYC